MGLVGVLSSVIYAVATVSTSLTVEANVDVEISSTAPVVTTAQGVVQGAFDTHGNRLFLGIPFAASTAGDNRWTAPQSPANHTDIYNATSFGPTCPQAITGTSYTQQDEDCLSVNVWAPANSTNSPVFVYIYGGAMVTGSSSNPQLQGNNFASNDVIYVSFNTRESIFASPFSAELTDTVQNFGILDVNFAMEWIHDNIAAFGGNASHIVLGGHSSGAVHVDHYLWSHPDTFVVGAIEMSANSVSGPGYAPQNVGLDTIAGEVGCSNGTGQLACLRTKSIFELQTAYFNSTANTWFAPVIDNFTRFAPSLLSSRFSSGKYPSQIPLITGNSNAEGTIFSTIYASEDTNFTAWISTFDADSAHIPSDVLVSAYNSSSPSLSSTTSQASLSGKQYGDIRFDCAVDSLLALRASVQPIWTYRFFGAYDNVVGVSGTAPTHGTEVPFFLGGNECFDSLTNVTTAQQELADSIFGWFVNWIKDPTAGPGWEQASGDGGVVMKLGVPGNETATIVGSLSDYNAICREVYNERYNDYPVLINPITGGRESI